MTAPTPTARLVCRSGTLAGSSFELAGDTTLGVDGAGSPAVGGGAELAAVHARIRSLDGGFVLEEVAGGSARVDGQPLRGSAPLERMHVIEVAGQEFVFSRSMVRRPPAAAAPETDAGPTADPAPPTVLPPAPGAGGEHTVVDMMVFGALPDLGRGPSPAEDSRKADSPGSRGGDSGAGVPPLPPRPSTASPPASAPPAAGEHTVVDMAGFGMLPEFSRPPAPAPLPPPPPPLPPPPPPPPPPTPPPTPPPPPPPPPPTTPPPSGAEDATRVGPAMPVYELVVLPPTGDALHFPLMPGDNVIGRGADADIRLEDPEMWLSRKHALVRVGVAGVELVDLGARNGTFVGSRRIESATLTPGSSFLLGPHLEFQLRQQ